jgi:transcriptional/translational regulatory protein YebC/TACO1
VTDADTARTLLKLVDALEDSDDVQHVTTNADIDDALMEGLMEA